MQPESLQSDPLQFAYKENASTVQCASVICEMINYYRSFMYAAPTLWNTIDLDTRLFIAF